MQFKRNLLLAAAIIITSCSTVIKYSALPEVTKWETEIQKFEALDQSESYPYNSVIFAGSSSIRLWKNLQEDMAPYPVIRRGYGGARLSDFSVYAERILYPHKASAIVLFIANDISAKDNDKTPREVLRLFKNVVKTIQNKFPETPLFWVSITPTASRWAAWPQIKEANRLISEFCTRTRNLYFIDTEQHFLDQNGLPRNELFTHDKLHLNDEGYKVWTAIIKTELNSILEL